MWLQYEKSSHSAKKYSVQYLFDHGVQRGIYPTLMVRHTIKPGLFEKPHTKHHQCGRSGSRRRAKASVPLARRPRSLPRRPEHARSHGTAASAAGKFCCTPFHATENRFRMNSMISAFLTIRSFLSNLLSFVLICAERLLAALKIDLS